MAQTDKLYISFERSGGFAGMTTTLTVSSDTLDETHVKRLVELIQHSGFFEYSPSDSHKDPYPDQFQYVITIELNGKRKTIDSGESSIPASFQPLIRELTTMARQKPGG